MCIQALYVTPHIGFVCNCRKPQTARTLYNSSVDKPTVYDQLLRNSKEWFVCENNLGDLEAQMLVSKGRVLHDSCVLEFRATSYSTGRKSNSCQGHAMGDMCHSVAVVPGKVMRLWNGSVCGSDRNLHTW